MNFVVDIILALILILSTYIGYKKGLVGVVFKILSFFAALIIVFILYKPVSQLIIDNTMLDEKISSSIQQNLSDYEFNGEGTLVITENTKVSQGIVNLINKILKNTTKSIKNDAIIYVSTELTTFIVRIITMIGLFVVVRLLLLIAQSLVEFIAELPIICLFDKSGGIIYGVIKGFLIIYFILAIISLLSPIISNWGLVDLIESSYVGKIMYNNNILLNFIIGK